MNCLSKSTIWPFRKPNVSSELSVDNYEEEISQFLGRPNLTNFQVDGPAPTYNDFEYKWASTLKKSKKIKDIKKKKSTRFKFINLVMSIL